MRAMRGGVAVEGGRKDEGKWSCAQTMELAERMVMGMGSRRSTFCRSVSIISHAKYDGKGAKLPVGFGRDEFGDRVRKSRERTDVEDGERVFSVIHATHREDDGDEMEAGVFKQRRGTGFGEVLWRC